MTRALAWIMRPAVRAVLRAMLAEAGPHAFAAMLGAMPPTFRSTLWAVLSLDAQIRAEWNEALGHLEAIAAAVRAPEEGSGPPATPAAAEGVAHE